MRTATVGFDARVRDAWDEHHERLWRALLAWSGSREVASDACAEAFAQVLRRGEVVDDVGAWVWRAAFKIAGGLLSERKRDEVEVLAVGSDASEVVALADALARLGDDDRTVVVLCLVGGWSAGDVAAMTGSTAGAVRVRLHRARARLRELLEVDDG